MSNLEAQDIKFVQFNDNTGAVSDDGMAIIQANPWKTILYTSTGSDLNERYAFYNPIRSFDEASHTGDQTKPYTITYGIFSSYVSNTYQPSVNVETRKLDINPNSTTYTKRVVREYSATVEGYNNVNKMPASLIDGLSTVATTGDYNDLSNNFRFIQISTSSLVEEYGAVAQIVNSSDLDYFIAHPEKCILYNTETQ